MISDKIGSVFTVLRDFLVDFLASRNVNPNLITFTGLAINIFAATSFAFGRMMLAGILIICAGAFDILDGAVARKSGRVSSFGGFFDSVIDRYSDLIIYIGLIMFFARIGAYGTVVLTSVASMGSILVSYSRARAENVIESCKVGFWERPERLVLLILGALSSNVIRALWILAVLANVTVIHRILHTWIQTTGRELYRSPEGKSLIRFLSILLWTHKRGSLQYDLYCAIVLLIMFGDRLIGLFY